MLIATTKILMRSPIFDYIDTLERLKLLIKLIEDQNYPVDMFIETTQHGWIALGPAQHTYYPTVKCLQIYSPVMTLARDLFVTTVHVKGVGSRKYDPRNECLKGQEVQFTFELEMS